MSKEISYSSSARERLIAGVDVVADTVKVTLGPKGRNVIIGKAYGTPQIVNDGVTIAKEIDLKDPLENAGAQLLKEVSSKTNDVAGDGTTTASVLAQSIIHEGLKAIENNGNPVLMKEGINKATSDVVKFIKDKSIEVDDKTLEQVATVSAGNNEVVGKLIAEAIRKVGDDGVVTVEESKTAETTLKMAEGMQLDKGYISPYFVTDPERQETVLEKPYILLVNKKINLLSDIIPIMEHSARDNRPLVVIAEDVEGEALASMVLNTMRKVIRAVAIKAPGYGDGRKGFLEDLAVLTGGTLWTEELGIPLEQVTPASFGHANRVVVKKDETTIVVDESTKTDIANRITTLKKQIELSESDWDKEKLQQRIAKLSGGVAVIQVGAASEVELKEKKLRIEDALNATKAAKEEGIVAGGGYTLFEAQRNCARDWETSPARDDYGTGYDILISALSLPLKQIAENAGKDGNNVLIECANKSLGYNALTDNYENLLETGVIDPAKVTRSALENAASIAGMLLTTEAAIVEEPVEEDSLQPRGMTPLM